MSQDDDGRLMQAGLHDCFTLSESSLQTVRELGMDENYAQVTLLECSICGQLWVRYHYELEAITASGRWYLGAITSGQASNLTAENAKEMLESLDWYIYGGSYYGGRIGRASGRIYIGI